MVIAKNSILLNAEPFGFGPAAAIAAIAAMLQVHNVPLGYIGEDHTHDLQQAIGYRDRYDVSGHGPKTRLRVWREAAQIYGTFMTAMDFAAAEQAQRAGMQVIVYDALSWYWPDIPDAIKKADLYIAQDFYGVRPRVAAEISPHTKTKVVPPIVSCCSSTKQRDVVLLNLGGLQNPIWQEAQAVNYARVMVAAVRSIFPPPQKLRIATSRRIAQALQDPDVKTYGAGEIQTILSRTSLAIMTPGLGNIYDSAAYSIPTVWLPPQ
ncbi:MAG TPA: hypothetical protein VGS08_04435 [Candidatus Saccharimonadales bacterium]|nr:hypothetical protein [Candidatus Saccharimonadales bacterium]